MAYPRAILRRSSAVTSTSVSPHYRDDDMAPSHGVSVLSRDNWRVIDLIRVYLVQFEVFEALPHYPRQRPRFPLHRAKLPQFVHFPEREVVFRRPRVAGDHGLPFGFSRPEPVAELLDLADRRALRQL